MNVVIVGNGPSMLKEHHGRFIDSQDKIIRLKRCGATLSLPNHFGSRTDIIAGSVGIAAELMDIGNEKTVIWIFTDSRNVSDSTVNSVIQYIKEHNRPVFYSKALCEAIDEKYRDMREKFLPDPQTAHINNLDSDVDHNGQTLGHNHTSQGMKAIYYALNVLKPDKLTLVGFDNVQSGTFNFSLTRGISHSRYPMHNWPTESRLLKQLQTEHPNTEIVFK